jgi:YYY domain-containing protein
MAAMLWQALAWYAVVATAGVAMAGALRRVGVGAGAGWAVARVAGWTVQGYVAWVVGWLGFANWWWVGVPVLAAVLWWGLPGLKAIKPRALLEAELVGVGAFLLLAFLRLSSLAVTATEKPMDLGILATLMRPGAIPPGDMWLAGHTLPYYYFGFVPWLLPAKILGFAPDVVFNLLLPTLAAMSAQAAWALARALGGSRRSGVMAGFLVVFAGTFDGWRQLFSGVALSALNLWPSSRAIKGAITEFPLFTFQLGDLHPHLLCVPLLLVAVFLGWVIAEAKTRWIPALAVGTVVYGAAAAANPWCAIPSGIAILIVAISTEAGLVGPSGPGLHRWLRVVALGVLGWIMYLPFWMNFHPPTQGFGWVTTGTRIDEVVLFIGVALIPPVLVAWELSWRWGGVEAVRRQFSRAVFVAGTMVFAVLSGRPLLAIAVGVGVLFAVTVVRGHHRRGRPVFALTLVPLALLAFMELVFFKDPYGVEYYRMNTVFKASHLAFTLLAVVAPVLLGWLYHRKAALAIGGTALVLLGGMPQLVCLGERALSAPGSSWSGLAWMAPGESDAAAWLRRQPSGTVLIEGVGDAYSDAARMSAASGVPAVLGWENHEEVWRGASLGDAAARRKEQIKRLYTCGDPREVRAVAQGLDASLIVVGSVERRLYPGPGLEAVLKAGKVAFQSGQCAIVSVRK